MCVLLSFLLIVSSQLLGMDDEDGAAAPRVALIQVVHVVTDNGCGITISNGAVSFAHSFPLAGLEIMNHQGIKDHVWALLNGALLGDLSPEHKSLIASLKADQPKVTQIVTFLFNNSRRIVTPIFTVHIPGHWGEAH